MDTNTHNHYKPKNGLGSTDKAQSFAPGQQNRLIIAQKFSILLQRGVFSVPDNANECSELRLIWSESGIRNIKALAEELSVPMDADRKRLEEAVILAAFRKWGAEFGKHLYGRFSAVIEDSREKKLYLVRDHFGLAPLYYGVSGGTLCSSPCLRSVTEQLAFPKELNERALISYFIYGYPVGPETFY